LKGYLFPVPLRQGSCSPLGSNPPPPLFSPYFLRKDPMTDVLTLVESSPAFFGEEPSLFYRACCPFPLTGFIKELGYFPSLPDLPSDSQEELNFRYLDQTPFFVLGAHDDTFQDPNLLLSRPTLSPSQPRFRLFGQPLFSSICFNIFRIGASFFFFPPGAAGILEDFFLSLFR